MLYTLISIVATSALMATSNGLPIANAEGPSFSIGDPADTIELGKPSTVITWGKRDLQFGKPTDTITLGKPSTVVTWGKEKRDLIFDQPDTIENGKPTTVVTWGKRDASKPKDTIILGKPSTVVTWGK